MYYALEEGKVVGSNEIEADMVEWITQRLMSNPTVGARIELLQSVRVLTTQKTVVVDANDK